MTRAADKKARRIEVMREWREFAAARGHAVPTVSDMEKIGAAGELWPPHIDVAVAEPWRETIAFLLKQLKFGVHDPVSQLPDELLDPVGEAPEPPSPAGSPDEDPQVSALKAWRAAEVGRHPELATLKNVTLRNIVRAGCRTAEEISPHLTSNLRGFAPAMAAALATVVDPPTGYFAAADGTGPAAGSTAATLPEEPPAPRRSSRRSPRTAPTDRPPSGGGPTDRPSPGGAPTDRPSPVDRPPLVDRLSPGAAPTDRPPPPSGPARPQPDDAELSELEFAPYDYSQQTRPVSQVRIRQTSSGAMALSWPAIEHSGGTVVYRVVSGEEHAPYTPDRADALGITLGHSWPDERPFTSAVRHLQVWCHLGSSVDDAAQSQPELHARRSIVAPLQDAEIREDEGRVVGRWTVLPGAERVQIFRIPLHRAAEERNNPQFRIFAAETNLGGFIDGGAERGKSYLYQVCVEAKVGEVNELSTAVSEEITVAAVLRPVTDLQVTLREADPPEFDLTWSPPPGGTVAVFRTAEAPTAGVGRAALAESALVQAGLAPDDRLGQPITADLDGRAAMRSVRWRKDSTRAYFTPVTLSGGMALVGSTVPAIRVAPVEEARIVERTSKQVLTFAWPAGADSVLVFRGRRDQDTDSVKGGPSIDISPEQYERQGGMHFFGNDLPPFGGCSVHLVPVAFSGGRRVEGPATTLDYPGLLRLWYAVLPRRGAGRTPSVEVQIISEFDLPDYHPRFALVHNRSRFPLDIEDGEPLHVVSLGDPTAQGGYRFVASGVARTAGGTAWGASVRDLVGYLRLFVEHVNEPGIAAVALMDPPMASLRLDPTGRRIVR